jgi:hemin uptake protein HemP
MGVSQHKESQTTHNSRRETANFEAGEDLNKERIVSSEDLFAGRSEITIRHQKQLYQLKITKQDKLILTK